MKKSNDERGKLHELVLKKLTEKERMKIEAVKRIKKECYKLIWKVKLIPVNWESKL